MDDPDWYPPMLDYNLPEDSDYIVNLTFEIRAMMLEMFLFSYEVRCHTILEGFSPREITN